ncbi:PepSY domain-containing protein [Telluria mixta]|uniref:PepSY domain-containing protein n=1 Tax=Telluria mixta TaxID=34071 RepID=A0ABT2C5N5_9BURK|nr:PepSY domain-containing protein [Telluria mixta]MCS0632507.1 PepSY domain-containing protein [Telluria mixta]WEM99197.1 PepSY domain-containing protein [Telluria mixta]
MNHATTRRAAGVPALVVTLHRWIGLGAGLLLLVVALSGAAMVFRPQLEPAVSARLWRASACNAARPPSALVAAARAANPGAGTLTAIRMPGERGTSVRIKFSDGRWVFVDACSGRVLGIQHAYGGPFGTLEWIHTFGTGSIGAVVAGIVAGAALVLALAGLLAWRPSPRRRAGLAAGARRLALHRRIAPWVAPVLIVAALTGLPQALPAPPQGPAVAVGGPALDQAWSQVAATPWQQLQWRMPRRAGAPIEIDVAANDAPHPYATGVLRLDAASGARIGYTPYAATGIGHRAYGWALALHYGLAGGVPQQAVLFLAMLALPVLAWSGLASFLARRRGALTLRLRRTYPVADGILAFEFTHPLGLRLPAWTAGAHVDVFIAPGLVRQYSLCGDPRDRCRYTIAVLRCRPSRGGSQAMHETLRQGSLVRVGMPRNQFALAPQARHSVLVAGGIGVTPILAMADALAARGASFELHYACRSRAHAAFRERMAHLGEVHMYCNDEGRTLAPGVLLAARQEGTHLYVCGPTGLTQAVLSEAARRGWPDECVHTERFSPADDVARGRPFTLRIASSGRLVDVPADRSALAALADAGIIIPSSCGQGLCGSCITGVLDGEPDHRDHCLTPEAHAANDCFTPCCSRARGAGLVLDL